MPWIAQKVELRTQQQIILSDIVRSRTARSDHRQRANLILLFAQGLSNTKAGKTVELKKRQAGIWRNRWLSNEEKLLNIETSEHSKPNSLKIAIEEVLSDLPRPGAPVTFSAEQVSKILAVACEDPKDCGLPLSSWSLTSLQQQVIERDIVKTISTSKLHDFLKSGGPKAT